MTSSTILSDIFRELKKAKKDHAWPDHPAAQAGIVNAEAGNLMAACLEWKYDRGEGNEEQEFQKQVIRDVAVQTAAKAILFLENLK